MWFCVHLSKLRVLSFQRQFVLINVGAIIRVSYNPACVCIRERESVNKGDDQIAIILDDVSKVWNNSTPTFWLRFGSSSSRYYINFSDAFFRYRSICFNSLVNANRNHEMHSISHNDATQTPLQIASYKNVLWLVN